MATDPAEAWLRELAEEQIPAEDAATLFDDVRVDIRREAARCAFEPSPPI